MQASALHPHRRISENGPKRWVDATEIDDPDLTPTGRKKLGKFLAKQQLRKERQEERKRSTEQMLEAKRKLREEKFASFTDEERAKFEEMKRKTASLKVERELKSRDTLWSRMIEGGRRLVVDLEFQSMMDKLEIRSLCRQLTILYGVNLRASCPFRLALASYGGEVESYLETYCRSSRWLADFERRSFRECYDPSQIVYLTPDSETVLESIAPDCIYVLGGLVDRDICKNTTITKARSLGIRTARLPIHRFGILNAWASPILSLDQVFKILVRIVESNGDWQAAFSEVIPQRKRKSEARSSPVTTLPEDSSTASVVVGSDDDIEDDTASV